MLDLFTCIYSLKPNYPRRCVELPPKLTQQNSKISTSNVFTTSNQSSISLPCPPISLNIHVCCDSGNAYVSLIINYHLCVIFFTVIMWLPLYNDLIRIMTNLISLTWSSTIPSNSKNSPLPTSTIHHCHTSSHPPIPFFLTRLWPFEGRIDPI